MMVLGIDPGYDRLGVAVVKKEAGREKLLFSACLSTPVKLTFPERLGQLGWKIEDLLNRFPVTAVALETLYLTKNQKTATKVSEVRGMIMYLAARRNLKIFEYTPLEIKLTITGFGRADKNQVINMVSRLLFRPAKKTTDDEFDAIAAALTCLAREKRV